VTKFSYYCRRDENRAIGGNWLVKIDNTSQFLDLPSIFAECLEAALPTGTIGTKVVIQRFAADLTKHSFAARLCLEHCGGT